MMEWLKSITLDQWLTFASILEGAAVLIASLLATIFGVKGKKDKQETEKKDKTFVQVLQELVMKAEKFLNFSGKEKKAYVIAMAKSKFMELGYDFTEEQIGEKIEDIVALSKSVNQRDKDKM